MAEYVEVERARAMSGLRLVLTPADTRDKVGQADLRSATLFTAALVAAACNAEPAEVAKWRPSS